MSTARVACKRMGSTGRWPVAFGGSPNATRLEPHSISIEGNTTAPCRRRAAGDDRPAACAPHPLPLLLFALAVVTLGAGATDLTASLTPLVPQPRHGAPEWVEVKLTSRGAALREGALEFELRADGHALYRYRTHDLAFTGAQRFRFLLPGSALSYPPLVRTWRLRFIERTRTLDLGEFSSPPRLHAGRSLVLGIVRSSAAREAPAWQALRLETLAPDSAQRPFATAPVFLDSDDLPLDPLGYCAFDAVLLEGDALAQLREKKRTALARWVHAGGSLAVVAPTGFEPAHLAFLDELAAPDPRWRPLAAPLTGIVTARANFGRLLVAAAHPPEPLPAEWRSAAGFLWKLRAAPLGRLAREPRWFAADVDQRQQGWGDFNSGTTTANELIETLLPKGIRPLPASLIWGLALGFLFVAGPLEWWLLGALRRRRLTWIVFPCTALAFTALTVALARGHLGSNTQRGEMRITDLGADGRVVRETRIALTLPAVEGDVSAEIEHAVSAPIVTRFDRGADVAQVAGQFPARHRLVQPGRQWSPVLTRTTSFVSGEDDSGVAWSRWDPARPGEGRDEIAANSGLTIDVFHRGAAIYPQGGPLDLAWWRQFIALPLHGSFATLAALSPTGSASLADLACVDAGAPDASVLVAARHEGSTLRIWRRLFFH